MPRETDVTRARATSPPKAIPYSCRVLAVDSPPRTGLPARLGLTKIRNRWREHVPPVGTAIVVYLLVRLSGVAILWIFAVDGGADLGQLLAGRFDSRWYQIIAEQGYDRELGVVATGRSSASNLAFFPLFPALLVVVKALTPFSSAGSGLVVAWSAGVAAAWGIYRIGAHLRDHATGVLLVALWAAVPHAVVESMAYSETLFTALSAWTLYALIRRRWLTAGVICVFVGLSRPTASAVIAAVGITALAAIVRRQDGWRPWAGAALAPLGYLGYLGWVGHRLGRLDGYFQAQRETWGITFDGGADTYHAIAKTLTEPATLAVYMVTLVIALAIAFFAMTVLDRDPLPLVVFSAVSLAFVFGAAGSYHGKGRYLLPVFALLLPAATGLAGARPRTRIIVLILLAVISGWYGAYLTLDWRSSP